MNVQQVLQIMKLETLPEPSKLTNTKCIALVERSSGGKDYVIANKTGIVIDKQPSASVRRVIEYYPVEQVKVEEKKVPSEFDRADAIEFMVGMRMDKKKAEQKTDGELKDLLKVYGR